MKGLKFPWRASQNENGHFKIENAGRDCLALVEHRLPEAHARELANMLAASPDLIKACMEALKLLDGGVIPNASYGGTQTQRYRAQFARIQRVAQACFDALEKAKGKS